DPHLGVGPDSNSPKWLIGQLDDVALWTRSLSAEEVRLAYEAGVAHKAVTTVVVPQPVVEPALSSGKVGNNISITFEGKLQSAPTATGPWTDVTTASPYSESTAAGIKFFRAVNP